MDSRELPEAGNFFRGLLYGTLCSIILVILALGIVWGNVRLIGIALTMCLILYRHVQVSLPA